MSRWNAECLHSSYFNILRKHGESSSKLLLSSPSSCPNHFFKICLQISNETALCWTDGAGAATVPPAEKTNLRKRVCAQVNKPWASGSPPDPFPVLTSNSPKPLEIVRFGRRSRQASNGSRASEQGAGRRGKIYNVPVLTFCVMKTRGLIKYSSSDIGGVGWGGEKKENKLLG